MDMRLHGRFAGILYLLGCTPFFADVYHFVPSSDLRTRSDYAYENCLAVHRSNERSAQQSWRRLVLVVVWQEVVVAFLVVRFPKMELTSPDSAGLLFETRRGVFVARRHGGL